MSFKPMTIFVIILIILVVSQATGQNIISFGNVQENPDSTLTVDVFLTNTDTLAGMQIPLMFPNMKHVFDVDTVLFNGSRCDNFDMKNVEILNQQKGVFLNLIGNVSIEGETNNLLPGSGLLCKIIFTQTDFDIRPEGKFKLGLNKKAFDERQDLKRDFSFAMWKPDASPAKGTIEPFTISLDQ
jgi:hypothetical protein